MPASTFNWKVPAGRALEAALNRALALDPETRDALRPLDGHAVVLQLDAPPLALQVRVNGERVEVGPVDGAREADLSVRSTLGGLIAQLPWFKRDDAPPVGKVKMSGDAELARRLQRLAERFDPDWQLPFVHVFGDVAGVQVAKAVGAALRQARIVGRNVAESAAEYLTEESREVVGKAELHAFHDDVDVLRDDVERLVARVGRLRRGAGA
jgi:ubiquinone biosynthesis accessory factor UbiJ